MKTALRCYLRVSMIVSILSLAAGIEDYFVYFPNFIIPGAVHTIPVFVSSNPALLTVSYPPNVIKSYNIMQKYSNIPLFVESLNSTIKINVKFHVCSEGKNCGKKKLTKLAINRTFELPLSQNSHLLKVFTSRNSYKSSETIKIIVFIVRLDDVLDFPDTFNKELFKGTQREGLSLSLKLYKNKVHLVKTWSINVTEKFIIIEHKLPENIKDGTWKVEVVLNNRHKVIRHFKVISQRISSILNNSNIKIDILYDNDLTIVTKNIQFSVCARYSGLRALKGSVHGNICVKPEKIISASERPCVRYNSTFDGSDLCVVINKDIKQLDLRNRTFANIYDRLVITSKVSDKLSRNTKSFSFLGPNVADTKYKITFLSELYFKANLPYYGKVLVSKNNDEPYPGAEVLIQCNTVNFPYNWGHFSHHISDESGIIHFILSPPPGKLTVITCDIEDKFQIEDKEGEITYYRPTITVTIEKWKSTSDDEIQLKLMSRANISQSYEVINLEMQGNKLFEDDFVLLLISNGYVLRTKFLPKKDMVKQKCENRNDELGHYHCDKNTNKIVCLENWYGDNCLKPRCSGDCKNGICLEPNRCACKYGWNGLLCDKCVKKKDCVHGDCVYGNDCVCEKNWKGQNCDYKYKESTNARKNKGKTVKRATNGNFSEGTSKTFIYSKRLTLEIPFLANSFDFLMLSLTKHPLSAKLRVDPLESPVSFLKTNEIDINDLNFSDVYTSRKMKCLYGNTFIKIKSLFNDNNTFINDFSNSILIASYKSIIADQCKMPFSEMNRTNVSNVPQEIYPEDNEIATYDLLHTLQTLKLTPISSIKMVFRNCVLQMIREKYKMHFPQQPTAAKLTSQKTKELKDTADYKNGCNEVCSTSLFYDIKDLKSHLKPYQLSALCFDVGKQKPIFTRNLNLEIKPIILITIGTLKSIKINEVHQLPIYIVKTVKEPVEVSIKLETFSKCVSRKFATRIIMLLNNTKSMYIEENISFTCSGIFKVKLTFEYQKSSKIYPNLMNKVNNTITKTEYVVYTVNEGIYQYKSLHYTFCLLKESTKVRVMLPAEWHPNKNVKLKIEIENSLDYILKYLRYIYTNQKMKNIIKLTMDIYEMNLNKIQEKDKSYLNQSLDNIKKLLITESNILRKSNGSISDEHMLSLVNLCEQILNQHYVWKNSICSLVRKRIKEEKKEGLECYKFDNKSINESNSLILTVFIKQNKYNFKKDINLLRYLRTCYKFLNITTGKNMLDKILKLDDKSLQTLDETTIVRWIDEENDEVILSILYFHFQEKLYSMTVLRKIVTKLINKVNKDIFNYPPNRAILWLNVFFNFEMRFRNKSALRNEPSAPRTINKFFNNWTRKDAVNFTLSTINACSIVTVTAKYFQSYVHKETTSSIEMHLDKLNCNQAQIIVTLGDKIQNFDLFLILYPSGWSLDSRQSDKDFTACNLIVTNERNPQTTKIDFRMVTENCRMEKLIFNTLMYQNVTNYRPSYGVLSTKTEKEFHLPFSVPICANKFKEVVYVNEAFNEFCEKEEFVIIKYNKYEIKINSNNVVSISLTSLNLTNQLEIFLTDKKKVVIVIDEVFLWSMRVTYGRLCYLWDVIHNVFLHVIKVPNMATESEELQCQLTKSFSDTFTTKLACLNHLHVYSIKTILMDKGELQLQHFPMNCAVKDTLRVFDFKFTIGKNVSRSCLLTLRNGSESKVELVLLSKFNLIEDREKNKNSLMLSNNHLLLKL